MEEYYVQKNKEMGEKGSSRLIASARASSSRACICSALKLGLVNVGDMLLECSVLSRAEVRHRCVRRLKGRSVCVGVAFCVSFFEGKGG